MERKSCFGRYIYEDIECMTCKDCSACHSSKEDKERTYYLDKKLSKNPMCKDCIELQFGGKCNQSPYGCFGSYDGRECDDCRCNDHCIETSIKKYGIEINARCDRTINCSAHHYTKLIFNASEEYKLPRAQPPIRLML